MKCLAAMLLAPAFAVALPLLAQAPPPLASTRGALLYETHCVACHDTQVHWRDRKIAADWDALVVQVRRWQANTGLAWTDEEIEDVVRYLNAIFYRFPDQAGRQVG